ncbi:MAG: SAM-dependent chlorinase/fluorinase [Desulfatitalea sp.]|nr:SAM-dependent chlorinase/fluorinase [Desulfatitalea sp.]NNK01577.1 SAM-dependent chlorinase/fluorinase [Desulfatitalea sp.]
MRVITLLTDFGLADEYVAVMKGVMLGINPDVRIVDISHLIEPQDCDKAGRMLKAAYRWFPKGTIHLAVVDPGVGSARDILVTAHDEHVFIAPDNGVLTWVWETGDTRAIVRVEDQRFFLQPVSATFHGRDIFAPLAAQVSLGADLNTLGSSRSADQVVRRPAPKAQTADEEILGQIVDWDHFGNLRTNIEADQLASLGARAGLAGLLVHVGMHRIRGVSHTYADNANGELTALVGSRGQLEIATNGGSARQLTGAGAGTRVCIRPTGHLPSTQWATRYDEK